MVGQPFAGVFAQHMKGLILALNLQCSAKKYFSRIFNFEVQFMNLIRKFFSDDKIRYVSQEDGNHQRMQIQGY